MDLTLVALMLSQGKTPGLFRLQEQQYNQMAEEFLREWRYEFPLKNFPKLSTKCGSTTKTPSQRSNSSKNYNLSKTRNTNGSQPSAAGYRR
jgi:hypothetical protein